MCSSLAVLRCVRNLGVLFDPLLCFDQHVRSITRITFFHLRNIAKIIFFYAGWVSRNSLTYSKGIRLMTKLV